MKSASVACALFYFSSLAALPEGFRLAGGDAKGPVTDGLSMTIESGKSAIIDWQKFSVGRDEAVRFLQEGPGSAVLNRVAAGSESAILGMLESNGRVYLINPDGLLVGPDARIVTAGFIGSSLDVLDEDFLKGGDLLFAGEGKGSVVNKGSIIGFAGDVVLVAREARNEGRIEAPQGLAGLAAGAEVLLKLAGQERIFIRPDAQLFAEADNRGLMKGLAVEMKSGGSAYAAAVKSSGIAEAYSTREEGGRIYLCAEEGDIEISGRFKAEGKISVVGQGVDIWGSARLDASGEEGGGNISVSAFDIEVEEGAFFAADARGEGDGGRVVIIAENENRFFGAISSQALARGNGGFAEVSGGSIWVGGHADLRSASGEYGTFLCDPGPILINHLSGMSGPDTFGDDYITTQLGMGNFTINTAGGTLGGQETITVNSDVSILWSTSTTFGLIASADIVFEGTAMGGAVISNTGSPMTAMNFQGMGTQPGFPYTGIWMKGGVQLSSTSGEISLLGHGGDTMSMGINNIGIYLDNSSKITTVSGAISLNGTGGAGDDSTGVSFNNSGALETSLGAITVIGTGGSGGINRGINLINFAQIVSTGGPGADLISASGIGGSVFNGTGVALLINSEIKSLDAPITIQGAANGATTGEEGIILGDTLIESINGLITMNGDSSSNVMADSSAGIGFTGILSRVRNTNGNISMTGQSFSPLGSQNDGIHLTKGIVSTSGSGSITLTGSGSPSAANANAGVRILDPTLMAAGTVITTGTGSISISGTGFATGTFNAGVSIELGGEVVSQMSGSIAIEGTGSSMGSSDSYGIRIVDGGFVSSAGGQANLTGNGGGVAMSSNNYGIYIQSGGQILSTGVGFSPNTIILTGTGGSGIQDNHGIYITGMGSSISTDTRNLLLFGNGYGSGNQNYGVFLENGALLTSSGDALVQLFGIGGVGSLSGAAGVYLSSATVTSAGTGPLVLVGQSEATQDNNYGVWFSLGSTVQSLVSGAIEISGTGGEASGMGATNENYGVFLDGPGTLSTVNGNMFVTGIGRGLGTDNYGIYQLDSYLVSSSGSGFIEFFGYGSTTPGTDTNLGIYLTMSSQITSTGTGTVELTGTAAGTGSNNYGILIDTSSQISSTGTIPITLTGYGAAGVSFNKGVFFDTSVAVASVNGNIVVNGQGGIGTGSDNYGVELASMTSVQSTGSGTLSITGTGGNDGGNNYGVYIHAPDAASNNTGAMSISGTGGMSGGSDNYGVFIQTPGTLALTSTGSLTLQGTGQSGASDAVGVYMDGGDISSTGATVSVTGTGGASMGPSNSGVVLTNAATISGTGTAPLTVAGTANGTFPLSHGVYVFGAGSAITSVDGNITVNGTSDSSGNDSSGIRVEMGGLIESIGTGSLLITGTSGTGLGNCHGIYVINPGSLIRTFDGDLANLQGTSRGVMTTNHGIYIASGGFCGSNGAGSALFNGTTNSTDFALGVYLEGSEASTTTGDLTVIGQSNGTASFCAGVVGDSTSKFATTTGELTLTGTSGIGMGDCYGILLGASQAVSVGGDVALTGISRGIGTSAIGIYANLASLISTTGSGSVTLDGTGGPGTDSTSGIVLFDAMTTISAVDGLISLTGNAGGSGTGTISNGIWFAFGPQIINATGGISLNGTGGSGTVNCNGILMSAMGTLLSTASGPITLIGTGGIATMNAASGISMSSGVQILSASGNILLTGTGGTAIAEGATGIEIGNTAEISTASGSIQLAGTGGSAGGMFSGVSGIFLGQANIHTATGPISVSGAGGAGTFPNQGIYIVTAAGPDVYSADGNISMVGAKGSSGTDGILVVGFGVQTTGAGSISLTSTSGDVSIGSTGFPVPIPFDCIVETAGTGNLTIASANDILITGDMTGPSNAYVRNTGTSGSILLKASRNISMSEGGASATVSNAGSGNITLVVDNAYPAPSASIFVPGFGPGQFNFLAGSWILASPGAQVRIYTAMPFQNTVAAAINGAVFAAGAFGVDNSYEQYSVYFPDGTYAGPEFMFYYKDVFIQPPFTEAQFYRQLNQTAVNDSQLPRYLPYPYWTSPFLVYQAQLCEGASRDAAECPEGPVEFEAFIFENNVY